MSSSTCIAILKKKKIKKYLNYRINIFIFSTSMIITRRIKKKKTCDFQNIEGVSLK